jgi:hypothetical protein
MRWRASITALGPRRPQVLKLSPFAEVAARFSRGWGKLRDHGLGALVVTSSEWFEFFITA